MDVHTVRKTRPCGRCGAPAIGQDNAGRPRCWPCLSGQARRSDAGLTCGQCGEAYPPGSACKCRPEPRMLTPEPRTLNPDHRPRPTDHADDPGVFDAAGAGVPPAASQAVSAVLWVCLAAATLAAGALLASGLR